MLKPTEARVPKPGAVLHLYRDLWRLLRGERHVFVSAVVLLVAAQAVLLAVPVISGHALLELPLPLFTGLDIMQSTLIDASNDFLCTCSNPFNQLDRKSVV